MEKQTKRLYNLELKVKWLTEYVRLFVCINNWINYGFIVYDLLYSLYNIIQLNKTVMALQNIGTLGNCLVYNLHIVWAGRRYTTQNSPKMIWIKKHIVRQVNMSMFKNFFRSPYFFCHKIVTLLILNITWNILSPLCIKYKCL